MKRKIAFRSVGVILLWIVCSSRTVHAIPDPDLAKWNVVQVWPVYQEGTRRTFDRFSVFLKSKAIEYQNKGLPFEVLEKLSQYYEAQANLPGHGSGWIFMPKGSSTAFIVTNKHVAGQANSVYIKFEGKRHASIPESETSVIYTDPNYDIAIIAVDKKQLPVQSTGFKLVSEPPTETTSVWSAGFPSYSYGKNGTVFSLTSGHVSSAVFQDELGTQYIAHTATINQGNSGGPLLLEVPLDPTGFRVAGMNRARILGITNVNLAIPFEDLLKAIEAARWAQEASHDNERLKAALYSSARRLADELGSSRPDEGVLSSLVSYAFVSAHPEIMRNDLLRFMNNNDMNKIEKERFMLSPVEYSRRTLLTLFRQKFATGASNVDAVKLERITDEDRISSATQVRSVYMVAGKRYEFFWIWEHGAWRIADTSFGPELHERLSEIVGRYREQGLSIDLSDDDISVTRPIMDETPSLHSSGMALAARLGLGSRGAGSDNFQGNLSSDFAAGLGVMIAFPFSKYFGIMTGLGYEQLGVSYPVSVSGMSVTITEEVHYLQIPALLRLELPLSSPSMVTHFFASAGLGLDIAVAERGTFGNGTVTGDLSSIGWYDKFRAVNMAGIGNVGVEFGLGPSPSIYVGLDLTLRMHLLDEWSGDAFTDGANYHYTSTQFGLFVKYQGQH